MKTLATARRNEARASRAPRAKGITVIVRLEGEDARRFENYRGDTCPREAALELIVKRLQHVDSAMARYCEQQRPTLEEEVNRAH